LKTKIKNDFNFGGFSTPVVGSSRRLLVIKNGIRIEKG